MTDFKELVFLVVFVAALGMPILFGILNRKRGKKNKH